MRIYIFISNLFLCIITYTNGFFICINLLILIILIYKS
jgi:hypothetical protein